MAVKQTRAVVGRMQTQIVRALFQRRAALKRLVPIRKPIYIKLADFGIYVQLDDWAVGARIAVKRSYEAHVTAAMRPLLQPGMVMVDIGANIGYYTLLAATHVGPAGKVIAFEPGSESRFLLRLSLDANHLNNVTLYPYAVADRDQLVGLRLDDSNAAIEPSATTTMEQVRAVRLDDFLQHEPRIDLIKLDIEGAEGLALRGMRALLERHRPIIFAECSWHALTLVSQINPGDYLDLLRSAGYDLAVVQRDDPTSVQQHCSNEEILQLRHTAPGHHHVDLIAYPRP